MFLKIMDNEDLADDLPNKSCRILANVIEVDFQQGDENDEPLLDVTYSVPLRGLLQETFVLRGNAYLMNDQGKTISSFSSAK